MIFCLPNSKNTVIICKLCCFVLRTSAMTRPRRTVWRNPFINFILVTVVLYHIPIRYLLLAWGTKKLSIYGIKPNYKDNNELLGKHLFVLMLMSSNVLMRSMLVTGMDTRTAGPKLVRSAGPEFNILKHRFTIF